MKFLFLLMVLFTSLTAQPVRAAQELPFTTESIPQPIREVYDTFSKVKIDPTKFSFINRSIENIQKTNLSIPDLVRSGVNFWDRANDWFEDKFGVSLRKIIVVLGNFIVWILELLARIIRFLTSLIR